MNIMELPAFEVRNITDGHVMAVYASGRIEGFPSDHTVVVNRIPAVHVPAEEYARVTRELESARVDLAEIRKVVR